MTNPGGVATWDGNMEAFQRRGVKFLTYYGTRDPVRQIMLAQSAEIHIEVMGNRSMKSPHNAVLWSQKF